MQIGGTRAMRAQRSGLGASGRAPQVTPAAPGETIPAAVRRGPGLGPRTGTGQIAQSLTESRRRAYTAHTSSGYSKPSPEPKRIRHQYHFSLVDTIVDISLPTLKMPCPVAYKEPTAKQGIVRERYAESVAPICAQADCGG